MFTEHLSYFELSIDGEQFCLGKFRSPDETVYLAKRADDTEYFLPLDDRPDFWKIHRKIVAMLREHYGQGLE